MNAAILVVLTMLIPSLAVAEDPAYSYNHKDLNVKYVGIQSNGAVVVRLSENVNGGSGYSNTGAIRVDADHPMATSLLSTALAAYTAKQVSGMLGRTLYL